MPTKSKEGQTSPESSIIHYSKFTGDKFGILGQMWEIFSHLYQRNNLGALVLGRTSRHALLCSFLVQHLAHVHDSLVLGVPSMVNAAP